MAPNDNRETSIGSCDECRRQPTFKVKSSWAANRVNASSPVSIVGPTQSEKRYTFYYPTKDRRLSRTVERDSAIKVFTQCPELHITVAVVINKARCCEILMQILEYLVCESFAKVLSSIMLLGSHECVRQPEALSSNGFSWIHDCTSVTDKQTDRQTD